jgi:hypothetical protein
VADAIPFPSEAPISQADLLLKAGACEGDLILALLWFGTHVPGPPTTVNFALFEGVPDGPFRYQAVPHVH